MQIADIYNCLRSQEEILVMIEQRLTDCMAVNAKNLETITGAKSVNGLPDYFRNQHVVLGGLLDVVGDAKVINSYSLLETEIQLREENKV